MANTKRYGVELRTEEGWGHFEDLHFSDSGFAITFAKVCMEEEGWVAARVWEDGPSIPGDRMVWDSRDKAA